jgi:hypothetical protein
MHSNIIFPFMSWFPNGLLLSGFSAKEQHDYFFFFMLTSSHAYVILLDSIMVIISDNGFK